MKPEFTADGISVQTYDEIFTELADGYRAIYGADINLEPDSPDGQRVGIEAQARLDVQSFCLALYQQLDPDFAFGTALARLFKFAGITIRAATRSQVDVTVTTDRVLTLPDDYTVEDDIGQEWVTLSTVPLVSGANTVTLFASEFGAIEADAATVTDPTTIVLGVLSVTNPAAATVGRDEETAAEARVRRRLSVQNPATSSVGGMFSVVGNLNNVTDLAIYENDEDTTDAELDIGPHTIWAVVEGGAVADIAEAIANNKTGGTPTKGAVTATYVETRTRPDGSEYVFTHKINFDRPTTTEIHVRLNATRRIAGEAVDTALIEAELAEHSFNIFEDALASELYEDAYRAGSNFIATDLEVSLDGVSGWTDVSLAADPDEKFNIDAANVTVTEVIP